jgi:hypothetical protein
MSIVLHYSCPQCGQPADLNFAMTCQYVHKKTGQVCGYAIPRSLAKFNSSMLSKVEKHTQAPTGSFPGLISHNPDTGFYLQNRQASLAQGDVYLDAAEGFFCTYITPSGNAAIATVCSGNSACSFTVSGYKMPLNTKVQNLHGRYTNIEPRMLFVASPDGTEVHAPNSSHPDEYRVFKSGQLLASWNTTAQSGFLGHHVVIK